jgi:hypothetical protein
VKKTFLDLIAYSVKARKFVESLKLFHKIDYFLIKIPDKLFFCAKCSGADVLYQNS